MTKYLINRIMRALLSVVLVIAVIMVMIYAFLDREAIFYSDPSYQKKLNNDKEVYKMEQWERFGYLDYIPYTDYLQDEVKAGNLSQAERDSLAVLGAKASNDSKAVAKYVKAFTEKYESMGYKVKRLPGMVKIGTVKYHEGGKPYLFAYRDVPLLQRLVTYFTGLIEVDNIHNVENIEGERGLTFTWFDPVYGGEKFSPAIMGNGTTHKYLLYFTDEFPFIHQNLVKIKLGVSYSVNKNVDVFNTMTDAQGPQKFTTVTYPSGIVETTAL